MAEQEYTPTEARLRERVKGSLGEYSHEFGIDGEAAMDAWIDQALAERDNRVRADERAKRPDLPCDRGCNVNDGPMEDCSQHGRSPRDLWGIIEDQSQRLAAEPAKRPDREQLARIQFEIDNVHQIHGETCLCGFKSSRSRSRTEHLTALFADAVLALEPETDQELQDRIEVLEKNLAYEVAQKIKLAEQLQAATTTSLTLEQARWKMHAGIDSRCSEEVAAKAKPVIDLVFSSLALEPEAREEPKLSGILARAEEVRQDDGWCIGGAWGDYGEAVVPLRILSYVIEGELDQKVASTDPGFALTYAEQVRRAEEAEAKLAEAREEAGPALRIDDDGAHIYWADPVEGCWVAFRRVDCVGEEELPERRLPAPEAREIPDAEVAAAYSAFVQASFGFPGAPAMRAALEAAREVSRG